MMIKKKLLNSQVYDNLIAQDYDQFLAKIISARVSNDESLGLVLDGAIKDL